jgi:hypothetical protein
MKKPKEQPIKIIQLNVFPYDVMVSFGNSVEEIKKELTKYKVELDEETEGYLKKSGVAHTVKLPNRAVLIYFVEKPTYGVIAHEAFHAVWMILATMGVEPSVESEEVYAYMVEYLVNEILK